MMKSSIKLNPWFWEVCRLTRVQIHWQIARIDRKRCPRALWVQTNLMNTKHHPPEWIRIGSSWKLLRNSWKDSWVTKLQTHLTQFKIGRLTWRVLQEQEPQCRRQEMQHHHSIRLVQNFLYTTKLMRLLQILTVDGRCFQVGPGRKRGSFMHTATAILLV